MCETLQLNWKLPNPLKPITSSNLLNNNNSNKRKSELNPKPKKNPTTTASGRQKKDKDAKYGLRGTSIQKRIEVEGRKGQPRKRGPKPRPKPQPMSKYRRRTANLRERMRMGEINTAFEGLREKIPTPLATTKRRSEKLTKINILHVAINYIRALESILDTGDAGVQVYGTSIVRSPFGIQDPNQYMEHYIYGDESLDGKQVSEKSEKSNRRKKQASSSSSSSLSNSGSEDSGIVDEEMEQDNYDSEDEHDHDEEDVKVECPDWTELTSTLEFPSPSNFVETNLTKKGPPNIRMSVRANMDTLLTTAAAQLGGLLPVQFNLLNDPGSNPDMKRNVLQPIKTNFNNLVVNRQASFTDLGGPDASDLLGDLNALEDSLEDGFGGINFVHEDPFQIFI
jgi:bHLH factor